MSVYQKVYLPIILILLSINIAKSQTINVDLDIIIKTFEHNPAGININYLMDDDSYLNPSNSLEESLENMKIGGLRYPGGEKADNYLWSIPPYNSANPQFATQGNCNWPNNDSRFSINYINPLSTTLDFDEFMKIALNIGAKPFIVVAADAHYCTFCPNPPTLQDLITNAVEWLKYANLVKNYNIKYWMIGNESWNKAAYDNPSTALEYARDFIEFSKALKEIDSNIVVVANTQQAEWLETLLSIAGEFVDAVAISNYPVWDWTDGYDNYRNNNPNLTENITNVVETIGDRNIHVIISEYNSIDWNYSWENDNDLGHSIVNFQIFGDQIKIDKVKNAYLWNTRWVDNQSNPQHIFDAIDADGNLNATGKALSIWGNYLLDKLVFSTNDGFINSFASIDSSANKLNIFLINKDYSKQNVAINISNYKAISSSSIRLSQTVFSGKSETDRAPEITFQVNNATLSDSTIEVELAPLSINVISLESDLSSIENEFESLNNSIIVYPNPSRNIINVKFHNAINKPEKLKIIDYLGHEVYSEVLINHISNIDISNFPIGPYVLLVGNYKTLIVKY